MEIFYILSTLPNNAPSPTADHANNLVTPHGSLPGYDDQPTPTLKAGRLVEWFAGWASCNAMKYRRFQVVHTSFVERWAEKFTTVSPTILYSYCLLLLETSLSLATFPLRFEN